MDAETAYQTADKRRHNSVMVPTGYDLYPTGGDFASDVVAITVEAGKQKCFRVADDWEVIEVREAACTHGPLVDVFVRPE